MNSCKCFVSHFSLILYRSDLEQFALRQERFCVGAFRSPVVDGQGISVCGR